MNYYKLTKIGFWDQTLTETLLGAPVQYSTMPESSGIKWTCTQPDLSFITICKEKCHICTHPDQWKAHQTLLFHCRSYSCRVMMSDNDIMTRMKVRNCSKDERCDICHRCNGKLSAMQILFMPQWTICCYFYINELFVQYVLFSDVDKAATHSLYFYMWCDFSHFGSSFNENSFVYKSD